MTQSRSAGRTTIFIALACSAACGSGGDGSPAQLAVASVQIATATAGASTTLVVGNTLSLAATALSASNAAIPGTTFVWASSNAAVASVANGLVTAASAGTANITATSGGVTSAPLPIVVQPRSASAAHVYFLQFEGQALTPGADNPPANVSVLLTTPTTIPAYLAADAQRAAKIQSIVSEASAILAPYDIALVTVRPSTGIYDMLVAGGQSTTAGFPAGLLGVAPTDCATNGHHVSLLFDLATGHDASRQIVSALGETHGIPSSTVPGDCMCDGAGCGTPLAATCTIGGPGTPVAPSTVCARPTTMDEQQQFLGTFGAHP